MPSLRRISFAALILVAIAAPAIAQSPSAPSNVPTLHLTETAERAVARDRLRVELAAEVTDPDAAKVQAEINRRMSAALNRIKAVPDITVETSGYNVYQERPDKAPPRWHGSQTIALMAKDFAALLALTGVLQQEGLVMTGLAPELSREARQAAEDDLTDLALARLKVRAEHIAAGLGTKVDLYRDLRIGNASNPQPLMRAMGVTAGLSQSAPAPVAVPGEAQVSVTIQADIVLAK